MSGRKKKIIRSDRSSLLSKDTYDSEILAQEVVATVKARVPWPMRNGGSADRGEKGILGRLNGRLSADVAESILEEL